MSASEIPPAASPSPGSSREDGSRTAALYRWLDERLSLGVLRDAAAHKTVPMHRWSVLYYLGGMTLFFFAIQVVTGILLMLYYRPSSEAAFESVELIMTVVPFGWLIRSIHSWAANLMVFFAFVHLVTVFFMKAYRPPRELTWVSGVVLLFLAMGFGFSGYLLPWNQLSFFATKVGTDIAGSIPLVGEGMLRFLRGGDQVTGGTLSRFYGWHVAILPALTTVLLLLHLLLVQRLGLSVPPDRKKEARQRPPMKFFPHFALRDAFGWILALGLLASLAALFPWELGEKADPFAPAYADIAPEWYFMFMFQTLKLVPGGEIAGVEYEAIPILLFGLAGLVLLLVPFLDRGLVRRGRSPLFTAAGVLALVFMVGMTAWGYHSWVPVYVVILTVALLAILALGTRRPDASADSTRTSLLVLFLLGGSLLGGAVLGSAPARGQTEPASPPPLPESSCVACHGNPDWGGDPALLEAFSRDVHWEVGLSCVDCHGGNPDPALAEDMLAAMDPEDPDHPYVGTPSRVEIPAFCGRCHSDPIYMRRFHPDPRVDQEREYLTSHHGLALLEGDTRVATCIDCHGTHGILRPSHPKSPVYPKQVAETCGTCHDDPERMAGTTLADGRPLPVDQHARWSRSVHAAALMERGDLSAPTCNDCHGNHGATPPGVTSIGFVCGQCHGREAELFRSSPKHDGFELHNELMADMSDDGCADCHGEPQDSLTFRQFTECATCHGNHAIVRPTLALLAPVVQTPCALCHESAEQATGNGGEETVASLSESDSAPEFESKTAAWEPEAVREHYEEVRDALLQAAKEQGLTGDERFDWLVDQALVAPHHIAGGEAGGGHGSAQRAEFTRLFEKFRIGKTHFTYTDPVTGEQVRESHVRCTDCHSDGSTGAEVARELLRRQWQVTSTVARADRVALRARRGGVEVRDAMAELDQAVDGQIELEVLVHTFSTAEDEAYAEKHATAWEHATAALEGAREALAELGYRRRGLGISLGLILLVLVALGLKIRQIS